MLRSLSLIPIFFCASSLAGVRILLPPESGGLPAERALGELVDSYNRAHPTQPVEIMRKGTTYSSLKELIALHFASTLPDLAAIEASEWPAIEALKIARAIPDGTAKKLTGKTAGFTLPFTRSTAILVADEEMLFRIRAQPPTAPTHWKKLVEHAKLLSDQLPPGGDHAALGIPLRGQAGLWMLEALTGKPLWRRQAGGIKSNREIVPDLLAIRALLDEPRVAREPETWDRALGAFIDRKIPLLFTTTEAVPQLMTQAKFRWGIVPAPRMMGGTADLIAGTDLIVLKENPEIWKFLGHLYQPDTAKRWLKSGGYLPHLPTHRDALGRDPYSLLIRGLNAKVSRGSDPDVVRIREAWVAALPTLFGPRTQRKDIEIWLDDLDRAINTRHSE